MSAGNLEVRLHVPLMDEQGIYVRRVLEERQRREDRVKLHSIDRTRLRTLTPREWSEDAKRAGELTLKEEREKVTIKIRASAWQRFFDMTLTGSGDKR